jgi:hypothetical protein
VLHLIIFFRIAGPGAPHQARWLVAEFRSPRGATHLRPQIIDISGENSALGAFLGRKPLKSERRNTAKVFAWRQSRTETANFTLRSLA